MELRIPLHLERAGSSRGLIPPDAGHPGAQLRELPAQGLDLSQIATTSRITGPERGAIETFLIIRRQGRLQLFHSDPVALLDSLHETAGLRKQKVGIERKD